MAALFTKSEDMDIHSINRLGTNSVMREGNKRVEPRRRHTCCGCRAAALDLIERAHVRQILGLIFNLTHDNTARTLEPPAAAIEMSCSPTGQLAATTTCYRST
jgi:hypothetical protein